MMISRQLLTIPVLVLLIMFAARAQADRMVDEPQSNARYRPNAEQMILDGLIYRPLSLAGTAIGTGIFIVTLPFSLLGGNVDEAGEKLVINPARVTFGSCLGCITDYTPSPPAK